MSPRLKLYSTHHTAPTYGMAHDIFIPIWGGGDADVAGSYLVDRAIPRKPTLGYNEASQQYYVWKHLLSDTDYVGFEHYRRMIMFPALFDDMRKEGFAFENALEVRPGNWHTFADEATYATLLSRRERAAPDQIEALLKFVEQYDIVLSIPYVDESLGDQWTLCGQDGAVLPVFKKCIESTAAFQDRPFPVDFGIRRTYFCNIFVARVSIFDDYMRLWEQVMFALQGSIDFATRMPSFLSERLFSLYIHHRLTADGLRHAEVPFCLCETRKVAQESW